MPFSGAHVTPHIAPHVTPHVTPHVEPVHPSMPRTAPHEAEPSRPVMGHNEEESSLGTYQGARVYPYWLFAQHRTHCDELYRDDTSAHTACVGVSSDTVPADQIKHGLSGGAIAGIAVAGVAVLAVCWYVLKG